MIPCRSSSTGPERGELHGALRAPFPVTPVPQYLAGMYWTIATLMSVGYGDISADTNHERLFALVTMVRELSMRSRFVLSSLEVPGGAFKRPPSFRGRMVSSPAGVCP